MSKVVAIKRKTAPDIFALKGVEPIVALTSYHTHTAQLVDEVADIILVGDSVGMVMHGLESTIGVTLEMMQMHGQSVMRGTRNALVVIDMPFGSYEQSPQQAFANATQILKTTGAGAVKLEGGQAMAPTIAFLVERGIPVMAHVGMTPQSILTFGSFRARGRSETEREKIVLDAKAVSEAGAFAVVLEAIPADLAAHITANICAPTIGIGASVQCDGQILVLEDMLGLSEKTPKFVKKYLDLHGLISQAVREYAAEVKTKKFPTEANTYTLKAKM